MSLYLNYKLTLNSGEIFESTNGGYQGPIRDAFLAETPIAKVQHLKHKAILSEFAGYSIYDL